MVELWVVIIDDMLRHVWSIYFTIYAITHGNVYENPLTSGKSSWFSLQAAVENFSLQLGMIIEF